MTTTTTLPRVLRLRKRRTWLYLLLNFNPFLSKFESWSVTIFPKRTFKPEVFSRYGCTVLDLHSNVYLLTTFSGKHKPQIKQWYFFKKTTAFRERRRNCTRFSPLRRDNYTLTTAGGVSITSLLLFLFWYYLGKF